MSEAKAAPVIKEEPRMSTKKEQAGHALGVLGHDSAYTLWATWMTPFLTDVAMIPAAVLGALLAIGRVWDGFNDILMGSLVDRTRSKLGRFRPWIMRAGPLFCVVMAASFVVPGNNMTVRIVYACIMYILSVPRNGKGYGMYDGRSLRKETGCCRYAGSSALCHKGALLRHYKAP